MSVKTKADGGCNHLTDAQKFKLWEALTAMRAEVEQEGYTLERARRQLEVATGCPLTRYNVLRAAENLGVKFAPAPRATGGMATTHIRLTQLTEALDRLAAKLDALAGRVDRLEVELGVGARQLSGAVAAVAGRK